MHLKLTGPSKHLFGWLVLVRLGKSLAVRPSDEVLERTPPGLDLVVSLRIGVLLLITTLVIEPCGFRAVDFVPNESWRLIHQMHAVPEAVLKVDFVAGGHRNPVSDDNHVRSFETRFNV